MSIKTVARTTGLLFLTQLVTYFVGNQMLLQKIVSAPDLLNACFANSHTLVFSVILELTCGASVVGLSVILYPVLKQFSERIALWYVGFRLVAFSVIAISKIKILTLLRLSQLYKDSADQDKSSYKTFGLSLLAEHHIAILMTLIVFGLGTFFFYYLLIRSKLIPRFISLWGIFGALLVLLSAVLQLFAVNVPFFVFLPMGLNELLIGWCGNSMGVVLKLLLMPRPYL